MARKSRKSSSKPDPKIARIRSVSQKPWIVLSVILLLAFIVSMRMLLAGQAMRGELFTLKSRAAMSRDYVANLAGVGAKDAQGHVVTPETLRVETENGQLAAIDAPDAGHIIAAGDHPHVGDFPDFVPIYPDAKFDQTYMDRGAGNASGLSSDGLSGGPDSFGNDGIGDGGFGNGGAANASDAIPQGRAYGQGEVAFSSDDAPDKLVAFYRRKAISNGLFDVSVGTLNGTTIVSARAEDGRQFTLRLSVGLKHGRPNGSHAQLVWVSH